MNLPFEAELSISSPQNLRVKSVARLRDRKERESSGRCLVEGAKELGLALAAGYELAEIYYCKDLLSESGLRLLADASHHIEKATIIAVSASVYERLAIRAHSDGVIGIFQTFHRTLETLELPAFPLLLAVQSVEKPGNLGALLRTSDAAGVDAVVVLDRSVDIYSPNVIRASIGTVFQTPVVTTTSEEFRQWCVASDIRIVGATISETSKHYSKVNFRNGSAILLGSEAFGLSEYWRSHADDHVFIPMLGVADSLNVSTAGAVILYEALRQRQ